MTGTDYTISAAELFDYARQLEEDQDYEHTVAIVAAIMDGFSSNRPKRMRDGDGKQIAYGFARALMLDRIATLPDDDEEVTE